MSEALAVTSGQQTGQTQALAQLLLTPDPSSEELIGFSNRLKENQLTDQERTALVGLFNDNQFQSRLSNRADQIAEQYWTSVHKRMLDSQGQLPGIEFDIVPKMITKIEASFEEFIKSRNHLKLRPLTHSEADRLARETLSADPDFIVNGQVNPDYINEYKRETFRNLEQEKHGRVNNGFKQKDFEEWKAFERKKIRDRYVETLRKVLWILSEQIGIPLGVTDQNYYLDKNEGIIPNRNVRAISSDDILTMDLIPLKEAHELLKQRMQVQAGILPQNKTIYTPTEGERLYVHQAIAGFKKDILSIAVHDGRPGVHGQMTHDKHGWRVFNGGGFMIPYEVSTKHIPGISKHRTILRTPQMDSWFLILERLSYEKEELKSLDNDLESLRWVGDANILKKNLRKAIRVSLDDFRNVEKIYQFSKQAWGDFNQIRVDTNIIDKEFLLAMHAQLLAEVAKLRSDYQYKMQKSKNRTQDSLKTLEQSIAQAFKSEDGVNTNAKSPIVTEIEEGSGNKKSTPTSIRNFGATASKHEKSTATNHSLTPGDPGLVLYYIHPNEKDVQIPKYFELADLNNIESKPAEWRAPRDAIPEFTLRSVQSPVDTNVWISLPKPINYELTDVALRSEYGTSLKQGEHYLIKENPARDEILFMLIKNPSESKLQFSLGYRAATPLQPKKKGLIKSIIEKIAGRNNEALFENLNVKKLETIASRLSEAGFKELSKNLFDFFSNTRIGKAKISVHDLEKIFQESSDYSLVPEKSEVLKSVSLANPENPFLIFTKFLNENGVFCAQCTGGNELFAEFLRQYYHPYSEVHIETRSTLVRQHPDRLTSNDGHLRTHIFVKGKRAFVLDATPASREATREIQEKRALEEQMKKEQEVKDLENQKKISEAKTKEQDLKQQKIEYEKFLETRLQSYIDTLKKEQKKLLDSPHFFKPDKRGLHLDASEPMARAYKLSSVVISVMSKASSLQEAGLQLKVAMPEHQSSFQSVPEFLDVVQTIAKKESDKLYRFGNRLKEKKTVRFTSYADPLLRDQIQLMYSMLNRDLDSFKRKEWYEYFQNEYSGSSKCKDGVFKIMHYIAPSTK